jgi:hypothetical protein
MAAMMISGPYPALTPAVRWAAMSPPQRDQPKDEPGSRQVAILLACAAVLAAVLTASAALLSGAASNDWQADLGNEVKRSALGVEEVRYVYAVEADQAFMVTTEEVRAQELRAAASLQPADIGAALVAEADVHGGAAEIIRPASDVAKDPRYKRAGGGYDISLRLADATSAAAIANTAAGLEDPDRLMARGDHGADRAARMQAIAIAVGVAFLFGAMAEAFGRRRRLFLALGWAALLVAAILALAVAVLA